MFEKILIANRGEIACRVIRTARKMGNQTVAVCSDADKDARHIELIDVPFNMGPGPSRDSYLQAEKSIAVCKKTSAQAVRQGYCVLSGDVSFAYPFALGVRDFIDDVILPHETRKRICRSLVMLRDKKIENPWRKHGNIPL